ncbi:MAG: hypothetical protein IPL39_23885 [Opitutaceae bacterium]|nr:hypothetical protein [Opitutaceae bacterium]
MFSESNRDPAEPAVTAQRLYNVLFNLSIRCSAWLTRSVRRKEMRAALITIGIIFLLAGIKVIVAPRAAAVASASDSAHSMTFDQEFPKKESFYPGWACIGLGVIVVVVGLRSRGRLFAPPKPLKDQDAGSAGWD